MSSKNYIVTAHKATAVNCSLTGHFTGETDRNLLIAKHNSLEVHLVCPEGLKALKEINIYGKISVLLGFQPEGRNCGTDLIFILTSKKDAMILECQSDQDRLKVVTLASGNVHERIGKLADNGPLGIVDPHGRIVALRIYEGLLKIIPLNIAKRPYNPDLGPDALKAFNVRIEEMDVIDIAFIDGVNPTIAYIFNDNNGRHLKTVEVILETKDIMPGPWKMDSIELLASMLIPIPLPYAGLIIVGQEVITVRSKEGSGKTIAPPVIRTSPMLAYERLDSNRFLLGDMAGRLFMLFIERDESADPARIRDMKVELLGEISIPESISYLDNGVVYIGSRFGDSQLIRLTAEPDESGNFLQVLESFTNLAPIVDMVIVDTDKQSPGQGQLITCSGAYKDGSLRIIRSGVGINELANIDLEGVKGVWAMRLGSNDFDNILVITFIGQTRTLMLANPPAFGDATAELEVEEITIDGFDTNQQTYHCENVCFNQMLQVTPVSARLIGPSKELLAEWRPDSDRTISVCASNQHQLLVASGSQLTCITIDNASLIVTASRQLPYEIACVDATPLDGSEKATFAAVGLWSDYSARLLTLPNLEEVWNEQLNVQVIPRSILLTKFDSGCHLFVALGDGSLLYYSIEDGRLCERKRVCLGTQPMTLRQLGPHSIFACSDRPAIIHCSNSKLVFSHVNLREVSHMCQLKSVSYSNCVALVTATQLVFGTIDDIQKLHIRSVPLHETPRRIVHQPETATIGIICSRVDLRQEGSYAPARTSISLTAPQQSSVDGPSKITAGQGVLNEAEDELEVSSFVLFDDNTLEATHALHFPANPSNNEMVQSLLSMRLGSDPNPYFIVGTAFIRVGESEPTSGRLVVLQYTEGAGIVKVSEKEIKGSPYAMCDFNHRLLVNVNSSVRLFEWNEEGRELHLESSYYNNIVALYLKTKGDFALVGDLMRSMSLLLYKSVETCLEEIARDHSPNWMLAIEIIDDDSFLGADNAGNLFVCARETDTSVNEERLRLQETAWFHLADSVNVFKHGSLVMKQLGEKMVPTTGSVLFGTISGAIGLICQLPDPLYAFLEELQRRLTTVIVGVGSIEHNKFRAFDNDQKVEFAKDFIDGDLIEAALDLGRDRLQSVVANFERKTDFSSAVSESVPCTVDDLVKILEELSRMH